VRAGAGSKIYEMYISAMAAMNYSRYGVAIALGVALCLLPFLGERAARVGSAAVLTGALAAAALGVLAGLGETTFVAGVHSSRLAQLQVVETAVLLTALFVAVLRSSMDTWLWLALFVYAFRQALNTLLWAAAARGVLPGEWHPPYWLTPLIGIATWLVMIGLAWHRLTLARRRIPAHPIFGDPNPTQPDSFRSLRNP
jgi:hypothetical protein